MSPANMLIAFVIATQARSPKLLTLLEELSVQIARRTEVEVLVVINGVEGSGLLEGSAYLRGDMPPIHCHLLKEAGSYNARICSAHLTRAEFLWFLDDDVRLPDRFVDIALAFLRPGKIDFGGGPVYLPAFLTLPAWVDRPEIYRFLTLDDPGVEYRNADHLYNPGANGFLRRKDLLAIEASVRGAPYELGRKGPSLLSHEDTDLWYRLHRLGRRHLCCAEAVVYHDVHLGRLSEAWFIERADAENISLWCRLRNYGLPFFLLELVRKTPGIVISSARYFFLSVLLRRKDLARTLHFRERVAFLPYFFRLLFAQPLGWEPAAAPALHRAPPEPATR